MSFLKPSTNIWNEDVSSDADDDKERFRTIRVRDIDNCMLDEEGVEVVTIMASYIARQTNKNTKCDLCQELLTRNTGNLSSDDYLNKLSHHITDNTINRSCSPRSKIFCNTRLCQKYPIEFQIAWEKLSEYVLNCKNAYPDEFLCNNHKNVRTRIHRIITNIYYNNEQKKLKDLFQKDSVKDFKQRQRKRQKTR